nr:immunoglobulin heavy chain junction region [Macaca mulatta]MOW32243.1 immunoglobulin heavy chain junction region [Macaca mulatta]MOW32479.1 immunoglobulin heavy chain junction region [Macaca mulatta]MOW32734.1 immunoglobulin heavy chain junction region [Macaca mulatta]MOW32791.1 immunoglobulin heavy chain junction region [Macaca mulatta]
CARQGYSYGYPFDYW